MCQLRWWRIAVSLVASADANVHRRTPGTSRARRAHSRTQLCSTPKENRAARSSIAISVWCHWRAWALQSRRGISSLRVCGRWTKRMPTRKAKNTLQTSTVPAERPTPSTSPRRSWLMAQFRTRRVVQISILSTCLPIKLRYKIKRWREMRNLTKPTSMQCTNSCSRTSCLLRFATILWLWLKERCIEIIKSSNQDPWTREMDNKSNRNWPSHLGKKSSKRVCFQTTICMLARLTLACRARARRSAWLGTTLIGMDAWHLTQLVVNNQETPKPWTMAKATRCS